MGSMRAVIDAAVRDATALVNGGCDAIIVENMGDVPYLKGRVDPETVAAAAVATKAVTSLPVPVGVQLLAAANRESLGVAVASGATFIRAESFAYAHVADEGWIDASAGELLRARAAIGVDVKVWADIQKKHAAHMITADLTMADLANGAAFCGADVLIVTGKETGDAVSPQDIEGISKAGLPVAIGSGVTNQNIMTLAPMVDALIVGSWLKEDGAWRNPVDEARVNQLRDLLDAPVGL